MKKLNLKQLLSVSLTLFAIFFGAGNMIFPPAMGQLAGDNFLAALAGFILTDAGIAILGMIAVVLVGSSMSDLGSLVSKKFALCLSVGIYLLIGPLFAMSRTGSASLAAWSWRFSPPSSTPWTPPGFPLCSPSGQKNICPCTLWGWAGWSRL